MFACPHLQVHEDRHRLLRSAFLHVPTQPSPTHHIDTTHISSCGTPRVSGTSQYTNALFSTSRDAKNRYVPHLRGDGRGGQAEHQLGGASDVLNTVCAMQDVSSL